MVLKDAIVIVYGPSLINASEADKEVRGENHTIVVDRTMRDVRGEHDGHVQAALVPVKSEEELLI